MIKSFTDDLFVADYTNSSKSLINKRSVEFFSPNVPADIEFFSIFNSTKLEIEGLEFDNNSFIYGNNKARSQCEAIIFPTTSTNNSWVLFCELKYSSKPANNSINLRKAVKQLYRTRYYYIQENIISATNNCYLIASLPTQVEPFSNFSISQPLLAKLKRKRNIILRFKNGVEIVDNVLLKV